MSKQSRSMERRGRAGALVLVWMLLQVGVAGATPSRGPGFVQLPSLPTNQEATGGVAVVDGVVYVGQGSFGDVQSVVRLNGDGSETVLATGFASLAGIAYDSVNDRLVVGDNDDFGPGETLYGIPLPAPGDDPVSVPDVSGPGDPLKLAPVTGFVGLLADVAPDPTDPSGQRFFVTNASSPGEVFLFDVTDPASPVVTPLQTTVGFASGVVADPDADALYIGDSFRMDGSFVLETLLSVPTTPAAEIDAVLGGQFDLALDEDGNLYSTSFGSLLKIDPDTEEVSTVASGFGFSTGVDYDDGIVYALDSGVNAVFLFTVPEPGSFATVLLGLVALAGHRRGLRARC